MQRKRYKELYEQKAAEAAVAQESLEAAWSSLVKAEAALKSTRERLAHSESRIVTLHGQNSSLLIALDKAAQETGDLLRNAAEKDGWLYFPAMHPEDAHAFRRTLGSARSALDTYPLSRFNPLRTT